MTPRGEEGPDLTRWQFWWEFNKDPYLNLKSALHASRTTTGDDLIFVGAARLRERQTQKPGEADLLNIVVPALHRALESTTQRDIVSSAMVALAKIGRDNESRKLSLRAALERRLAVSDQEIRETAALALGIAQLPEAVGTLAALAADTAAGRGLTGTREVDDRTRTFACYGLGLIAHATTNVEVKRKVYDTLRALLVATELPNRNIRVAAICGLRLLRPNPESSDASEHKLLDDCVATLWSYYERKAGKTEQLVQAHVPPAIAQLLGRGRSAQHLRMKEAFLRDLQPAGEQKLHESIPQSCAIALGLMTEPSAIDEKFIDAIASFASKGKDAMTRYFALIALAEIGGERARAALLDSFDKSKNLQRPWAALALGVLAHRAQQGGGEPDLVIGSQLHGAFRDRRGASPENQSALAIALGLARYTDAADDLRARLAEESKQEEYAGYLCIGLALMDDRRATEQILQLVKASTRRPDLMKQAAVALGKLGESSTVEVLQQMLTDDNPNIAKLGAIANALGFIGDRRSINPLVRVLEDQGRPELSRAFAAVSLGGVCDKELLPWNSKIAVDMNYRAAVETLTNQVSGVLDIL